MLLQSSVECIFRSDPRPEDPLDGGVPPLFPSRNFGLHWKEGVYDRTQAGPAALVGIEILEGPILGQLQACIYTGALGRFRLCADQEALTGLAFDMGQTWDDPALQELTAGQAGLLSKVAAQLDAYFGGQRNSFELTIKLAGTEFQRSVWKSLLEIPYGQTWSYADLAVHIGNPKAVRAVGLSNGRNPIPVIIPCHRVIGKNGSLTGFGGGIPRKRFLLELEQSRSQQMLF